MSYDSSSDTREHIYQVAARLDVVCQELRRRGERHDASKLGDVEKPYFDAVVPKLKSLVWGSDQYRAAVSELGPALEHHYAHNSHHPEHYGNGVRGIDLIDLIEMYCDWAAATLRSPDGDMVRSIQTNVERYDIDPPLREVLWNTWKRFGGFCGQPEANNQMPGLNI